MNSSFHIANMPADIQEQIGSFTGSDVSSMILPEAFTHPSTALPAEPLAPSPRKDLKQPTWYTKKSLGRYLPGVGHVKLTDDTAPSLSLPVFPPPDSELQLQRPRLAEALDLSPTKEKKPTFYYKKSLGRYLPGVGHVDLTDANYPSLVKPAIDSSYWRSLEKNV